MQLNPALTGGFAAKYRVSAIYRDQWKGPLGQSIGSFGAALDLRFEINSGAFSGDAAGVGLQFITDQASAVDLSTNMIAISGGFHKTLARNQKSTFLPVLNWLRVREMYCTKIWCSKINLMV
ncbi:MAG: type IX secretion system membrane protein PorP/SprF [Saprospiraceae bacterium]|nr:type IX secretion system membrane protein PorP/SprF [Saprospiraceae bacterium]